MQDGPFGAGDGAIGLDLPPGFEEIALRESGDAFDHACRIAAERGAGTIVWVRRFDVAEFAVVLEPDEPLATARRALYLGMNALADAVAGLSPPEKAITFDWPTTMRLDGAIIGGGRFAWSAGEENAPPAWVVFGAMVRTVVPGIDESGVFTIGSSLEAEGTDEVDPKRIVEGFCRHLMTHVDTWTERGFKKVGETYLARLPRDTGIRRGIDANADLLIHGKEAGPAERRALLPLAEPPEWLDPVTGMPKL